MASHQGTYDVVRREDATASTWATGVLLFASVFMFVGGSFQVIQGLAALLNEDFFVVLNDYAYQIEVETWGMVHLACGGIVALAGLILLSGSTFSRFLATFIVVGSAMINFVYIPYQPVWSIVLLVIDGVILWALITYQEPESA